MHFLRLAILMWCGVMQFTICITATAAEKTQTQEEISWQKASAEVEGMLFTQIYRDSLRTALNCPIPAIPLRTIKTTSMFAPETLVYSIVWGPFSAGYVVLTTHYDATDNTIRVAAKALSNNFVSAFYKMRDYVQSTIDATGLYPLFFEQHLREGKKYRSNEFLLFDYEKKKVHVKTRRKFKTIDTKEPFIHDYLSVLYSLRAARKLKPGDTFTEQLFIHSKIHAIPFTVSASEPKTVDAGTFKSVLLVPKLAGEGRAFNKRDKLEIWLTDDQAHMPVAIRSKIQFGAIDAKLIWYNRKK